MPVLKRIVCLANSRKLSGRCIAGKEQRPEGVGAWIRPVSDRSTQEVSAYERQYQDGSDPRVLDIIDVPLHYAQPKAYQSENWLLDPEQYWVHHGQATWADLFALADDPPALWLNGSSSGSGSNDRVGLADAETLRNSLFLVHLADLRLRIFAPGAAFGNSKRRVQARFSHHGVSYGLWVTDPIVEREYLAMPDGEASVAECFATISLGEAYEGYCYKLVAALILPGA